MQDWTKQVRTSTNPLNQAKQDKWLNKDRLWNFIFCILSICGWQLTSFLNDKNLSFITSWLTILGVPLLVRHFTKTTFVKDTIFLTSDGREFDVAKELPNKFLTIISTFILTASTGAILDNKLLLISDTMSFFIFATVIFGVPTLFFIFKNCPISILFNYKFWTLERHSGVRVNSSNKSYTNSLSSNRTPALDYYTNPIYGGFSGNIYNKYR